MGDAPSSRPFALAALAVGLGAVVVSGIGPYDRFTWLLEVLPILLAAPLLIATYRRFPLTPLAYVLLAVHAAILALGGHYTYARVPLGDWVRDAFELARNPYDRIGHFAQGFVPAILAREVLLRCSPLVPGRWTCFLVTCVCLAVSAFYELVEWWVALASGEGAHEFLGTQGDVWDTQWDMALALAGAGVAQVLLGRLHGRQLARFGVTRGGGS